MAIATTIQELELQGGAACLDLVNSGIETLPEVTVERLHTYEDILVLIHRLGLLPRTTITRLRRLAAENPVQARTALKDIHAARKVMHAVFGAIATNSVRSLDAAMLEKFNNQTHHASGFRVFVRDKDVLLNRWDENRAGLQLAVYVFWQSARDTLTEVDPAYIRKCAGCEWLFADSSKSHRRKWCNMQSCGSVQKSKRYYRKKTTPGGSDLR
ncbi:MAG: hypothetical protein EOO09_12845 [Chitinophagaceae bacterium]|nr:MAG: hypothetical protein EOO09_12845 [Chitinophagaceae bacterium]